MKTPASLHKYILLTLIALFPTWMAFRPAVTISKEKPVSLFNGKDLTGWKVHGTEKWYVDNGDLICESGPDKKYGYLATEKSYKDFELTLEFKQESNGNSGVFFRSSLDGT